MTSDRNLELISAALDRELDIDERAEVEELLKSSADARALRSDFERLDSILEALPHLEPPATLHEQVLALASEQAVGDRERDTRLRRWFWPGAGLRYALAAAAGAILAVLIIGSPFELSDLAGAMAPTDASIVDSFTYRDNMVRLRRGAGSMYLDIQTNEDTALEISIDLSASGYWPDVSAQVEGRPASLAIAGQSLQLRSQGANRLTVLLRRDDDAALADDARITLEFSSDGRLLQQAELKAAW